MPILHGIWPTQLVITVETFVNREPLARKTSHGNYIYKPLGPQTSMGRGQKDRFHAGPVHSVIGQLMNRLQRLQIAPHLWKAAMIMSTSSSLYS